MLKAGPMEIDLLNVCLQQNAWCKMVAIFVPFCINLRVVSRQVTVCYIIQPRSGLTQLKVGMPRAACRSRSFGSSSFSLFN